MEYVLCCITAGEGLDIEYSADEAESEDSGRLLIFVPSISVVEREVDD